jgi:MOSC domain-containing protein YiiM
MMTREFKTMVLRGIAIRAAKYAPMQVLTQAVLGCDVGVQGDSRGRASARQVTLLSADSWRQVCDAYGQPLSWLIRRANLLFEGYIFSQKDVGSTVTIGQAVLLITRECDPCYRMDQQAAGLTALLRPPFTAGVCAKVLQGGAISEGGVATIIAPPLQAPLF